MKIGVYCIRNIVNGKRYVGSSINLPSRKRMHWYQLKRGTNGCILLQRAWDKHSAAAFVFEILEHCDPGVLLKREDWWIDHLQARDREKGYNLGSAVRGRFGLKHSDDTKAKIGAANSGKSPSPETRAKMADAKRKAAAEGRHNATGHVVSAEQRQRHSEVMKGRPAPNRGVPMTEAAKAKVSAARKGKPVPALQGRVFSEETRAKMSASKKGKPGCPWSEERRMKQSEAMRGNHRGHRKAMPPKCPLSCIGTSKAASTRRVSCSPANLP